MPRTLLFLAALAVTLPLDAARQQVGSCSNCRLPTGWEAGHMMSAMDQIDWVHQNECNEAYNYLIDALHMNNDLYVDSVFAGLDEDHIGFHYWSHSPDIKFRKSFVYNSTPQQFGYLMAHEAIHHIYPELTDQEVIDMAWGCVYL